MQTVNESMTAIYSYMATMPEGNDEQLNLIFFTVTPSDESIVINVIEHLGNLTNTTSLRDYARGMRPPTMTALTAAFTEEHKKINIVSVDWPTDELVAFVIGLNYA